MAPLEPKEKSFLDNPEGKGSTPSEISEHIHIPTDPTTWETIIRETKKKLEGEEINPI